jgi:hypothetical protein
MAKEVQPPDKGILSRTLFSDDRLKVVLFGFAQEEELSEHTASMSAILQFIQGEATVTLGDDKHEAKAGTWVHMPTGLRHSIQAKTPVVKGRIFRLPPIWRQRRATPPSTPALLGRRFCSRPAIGRRVVCWLPARCGLRQE